jgi:class 3 adenylate cyclase
MKNSLLRKLTASSGGASFKRGVPANSIYTKCTAAANKRVPDRGVVRARPSHVILHKQSNGIKFQNAEIADKFNPAMLDIGNLNTPCEEKSALAAVFDITDFTKFCNQVDAYMEIPRFLNYFLKWFFACIIQGLTEENDGVKSTFWTDLPMMVKFLGDGLLIVWNTQRMDSKQACRLVATLYNICKAYSRDFHPQINSIVSKPPGVLRCGIARGRVFSIGGGRDYVGHCINNASRLSHLDGLNFGFPQRGFQIKEDMPQEYARLFIPKYVSIKGVGDNEMIWVVKEEFNRLPPEKKKQYRSLEETLAIAEKYTESINCELENVNG